MLPCSVALIANFLPPYRRALFRALAGEVARLTVLVATDMESGRPWQADLSGLSVQRMRSLTRIHYRRHPDGFREQLISHFAWDMLPRLAALAPDQVICGEFGPSTLQACLYRRIAPLVGRRTRLLIWATVSEQTERGRGGARSIFRRLVARMADGVLTNGASGARYLESVGFAPERIFVVHQSTDLDRFESLGAARVPAADGTIRLVSVGSLIQRKGLVPFLERLADWCRAHPARQVQWRLIGDGPERAALEKAALPDNLTLDCLGNCPYEAVPALLAEGDLFAFPTLADEWGLVVNEAMAAGLPVLASRNAGAASEMVIEGENGWLFDPGDRGETERALKAALEATPEQRRRLGANARARARDFSHDNTLRRILSAIKTVQAA